MTDLVYERIEPLTKAEAEIAFDTGDPEKTIMALLSSAYYVDDWRWVQDRCLQFLDNPNSQVRNVAVVSLGHIARIHSTLDKEKVRPVLEKLRNDPEIGDEVSQTLEEIEWYLAHPET
jgi:hypothetical protein